MQRRIPLLAFAAILAVAWAAPDRCRASEPPRVARRGGRLAGRLDATPFETALRDLQSATGLRIVPLDRATERLPVTATLDARDANEAVQQMLRGFSFVLERRADALAVRVLGVEATPSVEPAPSASRSNVASGQARREDGATGVVQSLVLTQLAAAPDDDARRAARETAEGIRAYEASEE
jgi:hypothetical protein